MTLFLCVLKPKPLSRKSFWLKHRGLLGFSRGRAVFLTISCLVGLTCPTWGRPSEVSFLERSSRKGPSSTRLDGFIAGQDELWHRCLLQPLPCPYQCERRFCQNCLRFKWGRTSKNWIGQNPRCNGWARLSRRQAFARDPSREWRWILATGRGLRSFTGRAILRQCSAVLGFAEDVWRQPHCRPGRLQPAAE